MSINYQVLGTRLFDLSASSNELLSKVFVRHPSMTRIMEKGYLEEWAKPGRNKFIGEHEADQWLCRFDESLRIGALNLYCDSLDGRIKEVAEELAVDSNQQFMASENGRTAIDAAQVICDRAEVKLPLELTEKDMTEEGKESRKAKYVACLARLSDAKWWRRQLRKVCARKLDAFWRDQGYVMRGQQLYVSDAALYRRRDQNRRNRNLLESLEAENEEGYRATLAELADKSVSKLANRRAELKVRMYGTVQIAEAMDLQCYFYTITTPSKYHPSTGGRSNPKYQKFTPKQGQDYLRSLWEGVRAEWKRRGVDVFGVRVAEPHADGTPHWHMMLFMDQSTAEIANSVFQAYAVDEDRRELWDVKERCYNYEPRFQVKPIPMGAAVAYISKYIGKNIDGLETGEDGEEQSIGGDIESAPAEELGKRVDAVLTSERVQAWAATWGIRQFQFIGSPSVTVYRELRRGFNNGAFEHLGHLNDMQLNRLVTAATSNDWQSFVELMGGMCCPVNKQTLRALYIIKSEENQYGEAVEQLRGIVARGIRRLVTRIHTWTVSRVGVSEPALPDGHGRNIAAVKARERGDLETYASVSVKAKP